METTLASTGGQADVLTAVLAITGMCCLTTVKTRCMRKLIYVVEGVPARLWFCLSPNKMK